MQDLLTLKGPITTAADNIHEYFYIVFQRKGLTMPEYLVKVEKSKKRKKYQLIYLKHFHLAEASRFLPYFCWHFHLFSRILMMRFFQIILPDVITQVLFHFYIVIALAANPVTLFIQL